MGTIANSPPPAAKPSKKVSKKDAAPPAKKFADSTFSMLVKALVVSGAASVAATRVGNEYATQLRTVFHILATFTTFVWGSRMPADFTKVVHPLVTCAVLTLGIINLTGLATGETFNDVLRTYRVKSLAFSKAGAGDLLLFCLGPTVVSFGLAMYDRRMLLKDNFLIVIASTFVSSVGGLFGTASFLRAIELGGKGNNVVRLSFLSRNVTTALGMIITAILGGDVAIGAR